MIGNNKLILNQETMRTIVQEWLERHTINCKTRVATVYQSDDAFEIVLKEKDNREVLLNE